MNSLMKYLTITLLTIPLAWNAAFAKFGDFELATGKNYAIKYFKDGGFQLNYFQSNKPVNIKINDVNVDSRNLMNLIQAYSNIENSKKSSFGGFAKKESLDRETGKLVTTISSDVNFLEFMIEMANKNSDKYVSDSETQNYVTFCNNFIEKTNPNFYDYLKKLEKIR